MKDTIVTWSLLTGITICSLGVMSFFDSIWIKLYYVAITAISTLIALTIKPHNE